MNYKFGFGFTDDGGNASSSIPTPVEILEERYYAPSSPERLPILFNGPTSSIHGILPYGDVRGDTDTTNTRDVEILQTSDIIKIPMSTIPDINGDTISYTSHFLSLCFRYNTRSPSSPVTFKSFEVRIETSTGDYIVAANDFIDRLNEFKIAVYVDQRPNQNNQFRDIYSIVDDLGSINNGIHLLVPDLPSDPDADNGTVRISFQDGVIPKFKIARTTLAGVPIVTFAEVQLSQSDLRMPGQSMDISGDPWGRVQELEDRFFIDLEFDDGVLDKANEITKLPDRILFEEFYARDADFPDGFTYPNNFSGEVSRISGMIGNFASGLPADTAIGRVRNHQPNNTQSTITMPGSGSGSARVPDYPVQLNQVVWIWTGDIVRINVIWLRVGNPAGDKTPLAAARNLYGRLDELNASIFVDNKEETEKFIDTFVSHSGLDLTANGNRFENPDDITFYPVMKTVNGVEVVDPDFYDLRLAYRFSLTSNPNPSNANDVQTKMSRTTTDNYFEVQLSRFEPRQLDLDIGNDLWETSFTPTFGDTHKVQLEFVFETLSMSGRIEVLQNEPIGAATNIVSTRVREGDSYVASLATDGIIDFDFGPLRDAGGRNGGNLVIYRFSKSPEYSQIFLVNGTDGDEFDVTDQFRTSSLNGRFTEDGQDDIRIFIKIWDNPPIFGSDVRYLRLKP